MEIYDQEITTAEDMIELVDDWLYGNVTMEEADEIVFDGAPYYDGQWRQDYHDGKGQLYAGHRRDRRDSAGAALSTISIDPKID